MIRAASKKVHRARGFTLLEILTVVIILGLLLSIVVPTVIGRGDEARVTVAKADIRSIANAMELYRMDNSHYPSTQQGIAALVQKPSGYPEPRQWGPEPYIKKMPTDPWGNPYIYLNDGVIYEVLSLGADGEEGGDGVSSDIALSQL